MGFWFQMKILNFLTNAFTPYEVHEKADKPFAALCHNQQSFIDFLLMNRQYDLAFHQAIKYYSICAPLFTAIDWIAGKGAEVQIALYDKKEKQYIFEHDVLTLLQNPSADSTYEEFMYATIAFYLLTGNSYLLAEGNINKPPISVKVIPPSAVTYQIASDGYPKSFTVSTFSDAFVFDRDVSKLYTLGYRYYYQKIKELYQIKTFNPDQNNFKLVGKSPLNSIYYEIEQYIASGTHNLSLLKRGATISGIFTHDDKLTDDAFRRLQDQINRFYSGEQNAGRPFLAEDGLGFTASGYTNKDMDFYQLKKEVTAMIYECFKIPSPLVSEETMTMSNMDTAKLSLYEDAILPVLSRVFSELTNFLLPRYPNSENLCFAYDEGTIQALQPRKFDNLKTIKDIGVVTTNELRAQLGYEPLEGGDDLYQPASNVPYARDIDA